MDLPFAIEGLSQPIAHLITVVPATVDLLIATEGANVVRVKVLL